jgi:chromate transporter
MKSEINFKLLWEIFVTFFKISPITFGGGFAMIPILETEMVEKKKWIDKEKIVDIFAVAQSVPGAIAVNSSIFLGYQVAGVAGAVAAMLGMVIPTFIIIIILGLALVSFQNNHYVQAALKGIRPVVVALIASAAYKMGKVSIVDKTCWTLFSISAISLVIFSKLNIIFVILSGALAGIVIVNVKEFLNKSKNLSLSKQSHEIAGDK